MNIPAQSVSYWKDHPAPRSFAPLQENISADVAVVGGGISGIMTAWLAAEQGKKVALIEARQLTDGTTGFTTAKVTAQHGLIYDELIRTFDEETARLYYEANSEAILFLEKTVNQLNLSCGFSRQDAYVYITSNETRTQLEKEAAAYETLGIKGGLAGSEARLRVPFKVEEALVMRDQAQFDPVQFLEGIVQQMEGRVQLFENTRAASIENGAVRTVDGFSIQADHIVVASHFPFNDFDGLYFSKLHAERSYAIGVIPERPLEAGMLISEDSPSRSVRSAPLPTGETLLIVGGENHPAGRHDEQTMRRYEELAEYAQRHFGVKEIRYRWSAQDLITLDRVPYIGRMDDNVYVATGFAKWGMTTSIVAARLISDLISGTPNRFEALYNPKRSKAKGQDVKTFVQQNAAVAKELVGGKLKGASKTIADLRPGEGGIVEVDGKKQGAYKEESGLCHVVSVVCTHMGCDTAWNDAEKSWDCPCHGSRFSYTGDVIEGPAIEPLHYKKLRE